MSDRRKKCIAMLLAGGQGSRLYELTEKFDGVKFDVILTNPPYIKSEDILTLQKEVKDFEPLIALDGGVDGFDFYKKICKGISNYLVDGGVLLLECGVGQAQEIAKLLVDAKSVEIIKDYENIDRIVKAVF